MVKLLLLSAGKRLIVAWHEMSDRKRREYFREEVNEELFEVLSKYDTLHYWEIGEHYTNDHEGKYFPHRFITYTEEDEDNLYFNTKEEALAHIRQQCQLPDDYDTFEKIEQYCEDNDQCVSLNEIVEIER